jgi:CrcB protein
MSLRNVGCNSELNRADLRHVDDFRRFSPGQAHHHAVIDRISVRLHNRRTDDTAGSHRADNTPKPERQGCIDMDLWYQVAALSLGGVLGVNARYWLGFWINRWAGSQFPWSTFTINITGSFAIGLCSVFLERWAPHAHARLVVVVGFLGGYTTFSAYSFESLGLWERGDRMLCLVYMFGSVAGGFVGVVLGTALGRGLAK